MLLTLPQPSQPQFESRIPHDFSPPLPYTSSRFSPKLTNPPSQSSLPAGVPERMSTQHRGLPPPSAMTLPDPNRPPPSFGSQSIGAMPGPPSQTEDSMKNWLATKAEEERRKQEEERTRQESLRLEQRQIEHAMLRESMQGGVPPQLVPMIFAGIGGGNLANVSVEWLQQYASQFQAAQQQQQQQQQPQQQQHQQAIGVSPELRRETRMINPAQSSYALSAQPGQQQAVAGAPAVPVQLLPPLAQHQTTFSAYQTAPLSPGSRARTTGPTSAPRSAAHSSLPRLTTNEMQIHQPPTAPSSSAHPLHQTQTVQPEQPSSSPSIYFHHWVPPTSQSESKSNQPQTPSTRTEPHASHVFESDYKESPKKRKAQGPHPAPPPPVQNTSPSFSTISNTSRSKTTHARSKSSASKEGDSVRQTPSRRDSGALGSQGGGDPDRRDRDRDRAPHPSTAPPSPPRDVR